jgi:histidyl-tRNA synthetase
MKEKHISTESYKGVRDFYPEDARIQQYIFETWARTAESFGFERYDASILEPSALYKAKGAENEEMVNEQTYTFTDRGDREVTLRPEMTPTIARMVAAKQRELSLPLRWYSIPNLFRYERQQKGRLREHWQLNCDIFGSDHITSDIEIIALANQTLINFGLSSDQFVISINDRALMERMYKAIGLNQNQIIDLTRLNDRRNKISFTDYKTQLNKITNDGTLDEEIILLLDKSDEQTDVIIGLEELGITNVTFDKSLARGFDYYTGTIFEAFALDDEGKPTGRSLLGGGRYDDLTKLFNQESVSGIGFGMGDVTLKDLLVEKDLIPKSVKQTGTDLIIIPMSAEQNLEAQKIALELRTCQLSVMTDLSTRKVAKKFNDATKNGAKYAIVLGKSEIETGKLTLKNLHNDDETTGYIEQIKLKLK